MDGVTINVFGEFLRRKMVEREMTLRELARLSGFDPSNLSKIERGVAYPPQKTENLEKIALALSLDEGETEEMIELALFANGKIPDHLSSVKENKAIPLLLRAIQNKQMTEEQVEKLTEIIESENSWQGRVID